MLYDLLRYFNQQSNITALSKISKYMLNEGIEHEIKVEKKKPFMEPDRFSKAISCNVLIDEFLLPLLFYCNFTKCYFCCCFHSY